MKLEQLDKDSLLILCKKLLKLHTQNGGHMPVVTKDDRNDIRRLKREAKRKAEREAERDEQLSIVKTIQTKIKDVYRKNTESNKSQQDIINESRNFIKLLDGNKLRLYTMNMGEIKTNYEEYVQIIITILNNINTISGMNITLENLDLSIENIKDLQSSIQKYEIIYGKLFQKTTLDNTDLTQFYTDILANYQHENTYINAVLNAIYLD